MSSWPISGYVAVGTTASNPLGIITAYDPSGNASSITTSVTQLTSLAVAPTTFGNLGGQVFITSQTGLVLEMSSSSGVTTFATTSTDFSFRNFGIAFAPSGWGSVAGEMLVSNAVNGQIDVIDSSGNATPFTTVAGIVPGFGLRQMAFGPAGFLPGYGSLLFVSVSGSNFGGGTLGDVFAIDSSGNVVASLRTDLGLIKFDPRGILFNDSGSMLVSDTSDPIYQFSSIDFQSVPEPSSLILLAGGLALSGAVWVRKLPAGVPGSIHIPMSFEKSFEHVRMQDISRSPHPSP